MEKQQPTTSTVEGSSLSGLPMNITADAVNEESLALLQQIYQHRQAEQYHRAQTNLAMQHLSYFQALHAQQQQQQKQQQSQQQQQPQSQQDTKAAQGHSSATSAADTSEDSDTQMSPTAKDSAGLRNRR
ncbi:unnamed protein product [Gongylonema pulchrum]|uniref:Uncharacterized protein n=1 Tax=Gongylonema pulchrum TaxID=637853 RepID=A0A183ECS3_9BILA|nr:unnamed protein product [Gongylonema pulchrum]